MSNLKKQSEHRVKNNIIRKASIAVLAIVVICSVLTLFSPIKVSQVAYCVLVYIVFGVINIAGFHVLKKDEVAFLIYIVLSAFIWVAYIFRFAWLLTEPGFVLVMGAAGSYLSAGEFYKNSVYIFLTLLPALVLFLIGYWAGPKVKLKLQADDARVPNKINNNWLLTIILALLVFKLVAQVFFGVGSPTSAGYGLPSIILAGSEFLVQDATIVVLNIIFFTALYLKAPRRIVLFVGLALVLNVILSLSVGWKGELVVQSFAVAYYLFLNKNSFSSKERKLILNLSVMLITVTILAYPYINAYRFAATKSQGIEEAVNQAQDVVDKGREKNGAVSGINQIFNRIDGFGTYLFSLQLGKNIEFPVSSILGNEFSELIKRSLYGDRAGEVTVAFATTQFAAMYLIGGLYGLYFGAFILGLLIRLIISLIAKHLIRYSTTIYGFIPLFSYSMIQFMVSGGRIELLGKGLFVVLVSIVLVEKLAFKRIYFKGTRMTKRPNKLSLNQWN